MQIIFTFLHTLRKWYWRTFNIKTFGVRVIIKKDNDIFLVKHRYGNLWVFPGGGMKNNENFEEAAKREVKEETNIEIKKFERVLGTYLNTQEGKHDNVTILVAEEWEDKGKKWNLEINESGFFDINNLPSTISAATKRRIEEYFSGEQKSFSGNW